MAATELERVVCDRVINDRRKTTEMYPYCCQSFLLLSMYSYCLSMYSYLCILTVVYVFLDAATLTEVFPCFFLGCKANATV